MEYYDLELIKNSNSIVAADKIIIYGAGEKGRKVCSLLLAAGYTDILFCDGDSAKWNTYIANKILCVDHEELRNLAEQSGRIYMIACVKQPREVWELFERDESFGNKIRFISYWGISQWLFQYRRTLFKDREDIILTYQIEMIIRKITCYQTALNILRAYVSDDDSIWILQPGKVGSQSMQNMARQGEHCAIHCHIATYPFYILSNMEDEWESAVRNRLNKGMKIITLVRNPLDRDYSAFWQPFREEIKKNEFLFDNEEYSLQQMYDQYIQRVIFEGRDREYGMVKPLMWDEEFEWFDREIKAATGIDIYQYPFDREKGFTIIQKGNVEIFLVKLEKLEESLGALKKYIGIDVGIRYDNMYSDAWYSMAYESFRKEIRIKRDYVNHYFVDNKKVDHFYSKAEQNDFIEKWKDNICE